jgi:hypothetical protein
MAGRLPDDLEIVEKDPIVTASGGGGAPVNRVAAAAQPGML